MTDNSPAPTGTRSLLGLLPPDTPPEVLESWRSTISMYIGTEDLVLSGATQSGATWTGSINVLGCDCRASLRLDALAGGGCRAILAATPDQPGGHAVGDLFPSMPVGTDTTGAVEKEVLHDLMLDDLRLLFVEALDAKGAPLDANAAWVGVSSDVDVTNLINTASGSAGRGLFDERRLGLFLWGNAGPPQFIKDAISLLSRTNASIALEGGLFLESDFSSRSGLPRLHLRHDFVEPQVNNAAVSLTKAWLEMSSSVLISGDLKVRIGAEASLTTGGQTLSLTASIDIPLLGDVAVGRLTFEDRPGLKTLGVPELPGLNQSSTLQLSTDAVARFSLSAKQLTSVRLNASYTETGNVLDVGPLKVALKEVDLAGEIYDPVGVSGVSASFSADAAVGELQMICTGQYPSGDLLLRLDQTEPDFDTLAGAFGSAARSLGEGENGLTVKDVELRANCVHRTASALIDIEGAWRPLEAMNLELDALRLSLAYAAAGSEGDASTVSLAVKGEIEFDKINIPLTASFESDTGWVLESGTGLDQPIPIGNLMASLSEKVGLPPPSANEALSDLVAENLWLRFASGPKGKEFSFSCESKFRADEGEGGSPLDIKVAYSSSTGKFSGWLSVGEFDFTFDAERTETSSFLVATYHPEPSARKQSVKQLVQSASPAVAEFIPDGLTIELKDVIFAYSKNLPSKNPPAGALGGATSRFLFGLDIDIAAGVNLSNLPLVGKELPTDATISVDGLQVLIASASLAAGDVRDFNGLLPDGVAKIHELTPTGQQDANGDAADTNVSATPPVAVEKGFSVSARINFGGSVQSLSLPGGNTASRAGANSGSGAATATGSTAKDPAVSSATVSAVAPADDNVKWLVVQKSFGPVYFDKMGVRLQEGKLWFLLNAALSVGGLTLSLDGLAIGGSLEDYKHPSFDLRGIGVAFQNGPTEIAGAFLRKQVTKGDMTYEEYDGAAVIKTTEFSVAAIGSYAKLDGHPSLFVYAVLDYPIGGPPFFFVTGLAAGFGYNRALVVPPIEEVAQFPLVAAAVSGAAMPKDLSAELDSLSRYVTPSIGEGFLAIGVKFTTFKLLDSFALLRVDVGTRFEINLLGLSKLVVPTPVPGEESPATPLAEVDMAFRASYVPEEGLLAVSAQLTPDSYILSRDCRLTGGFAFWSWFKGDHAGDFVYTLGGYHPNFNVPAHYPKVPRLAFNWRVDGNTNIKGEAYYALTASALMAGGRLEATWDSGDLSAWFTIGADFLISWKPYHYDASVYVDIGVSYTFHFFGTHHITVDVGADLHLWGPEFSGTAHIHLSIISFDVSFGAAASQTPEQIEWPNFRASFLPDHKDYAQVCSIAIKDGLVQQDSEGGWVVNPKTFTLVTNSLIPATEAYAGKAESQDESFVYTPPTNAAGAVPKLGIAPMDKRSYVARHTVTIKKIKKIDDKWVETNVEDWFVFAPILKKVPAAMWGTTFAPSLNGTAFVEDALTGFEIRPGVQPKCGQTAAIDTGTLQYATDTVADAFGWESFEDFKLGTKDDAGPAAAADRRSRLLTEFGLEIAVTAGGALPDGFLSAPQTGTLAP